MASGEKSKPSIPLSHFAMVGTAVTVFLHGSLLLGAFFVLVYIVPRFKEMFADMRMELPALTQLLIAVSDLCRSHWYALLPGLALLLAVNALIFWLLASRRQTWPLSIVWFLLVTVGAVGGGVTFLVMALFLPLMFLMQNIGQGG